MQKFYTLNCDGVMARMVFAEAIPHPTMRAGWFVDVSYKGYTIAGLAVDEFAAHKVVEALVLGLCTLNGLVEPPCINEADWRKHIVLREL